MAYDQNLADAEAQLKELRQAWADKRVAEGQIARLNRYRGETAGMKDSKRRALDALSRADAVIKRILG